MESHPLMDKKKTSRGRPPFFAASSRLNSETPGLSGRQVCQVFWESQWDQKVQFDSKMDSNLENSNLDIQKMDTNSKM